MTSEGNGGGGEGKNNGGAADRTIVSAAPAVSFRGPPIRQCASCRAAPANPYRDLCQQCFEAWRADGSRICAACRAVQPNRGHDLCSGCYARWRVSSLGAGIQADTFGSVAVGGIPPTSTTPTPAAAAAAATMPELQNVREVDLWVEVDATANEDDCAICLMPLREQLPTVRLSACTHLFHKACIARCLHGESLTCPMCNSSVGVITGQQPPGVMAVMERASSLPGYAGCGTLIVLYEIPSGIQGAHHPHPGEPYTGTQRIAYLPANEEGRKVFNFLRVAFNRRLVFTVGTSATTGRDDVVVWNTIHHKTNPTGGPERHGYPDPAYLSRVQEELAAVGIK